MVEPDSFNLGQLLGGVLAGIGALVAFVATLVRYIASLNRKMQRVEKALADWGGVPTPSPYPDEPITKAGRRPRPNDDK